LLSILTSKLSKNQGKKFEEKICEKQNVASRKFAKKITTRKEKHLCVFLVHAKKNKKKLHTHSK